MIARDLIIRSAGATFDEYFDEEDAGPIIEYFDEGGVLQVSDLSAADVCLKGFSNVPGLVELARARGPEIEGPDETANLVAASELVLEGLVARRKLSRNESGRYARRRRRTRPPGGQGPGGGHGSGGPGGAGWPKDN